MGLKQVSSWLARGSKKLWASVAPFPPRGWGGAGWDTSSFRALSLFPLSLLLTTSSLPWGGGSCDHTRGSYPESGLGGAPRRALLLARGLLCLHFWGPALSPRAVEGGWAPQVLPHGPKTPTQGCPPSLQALPGLKPLQAASVEDVAQVQDPCPAARHPRHPRDTHRSEGAAPGSPAVKAAPRGREMQPGKTVGTQRHRPGLATC